jgi:L-fuculose-phosphate aldolase
MRYIMKSKINHLKEEIIDSALRMIDAGVMSPSLHGNISSRIPGTDHFLLTAGGSLADMTPERIARFNMEGDLLEGAVEPAGAEIINMHGIVYRTRPEMGGVVHIHSPYATAFAVAGKPIPLVYEGQIRAGMTDGVPVAGYAPRGSEESVDNIARVLKTYRHVAGLLLANHGVLAFAENASSAAGAAMTIEESATLAARAESIGGAREIPRDMVKYALKRRDELKTAGGSG